MSKIVFTNGCFDIIHSGHISLLESAKSFGDKLIVGINSDESVRAIKGAKRPINSEVDRASVLMGLNAVDQVCIFDELTPENLIKELKPDVLVKGGDWKPNEIIGLDFVVENGGEVHTIPLKDGYSSSSIISSIQKGLENNEKKSIDSNYNSLAEKSLKEHLSVFDSVISEQVENINKSAEIIFDAISNGNKILLCGNGGSAADAQHLSTEFVGRYETERIALPAIALTTDTSLLTAVSNDYGFERVFSRQVEALGKKGDVLVAISTSGNSPNVIQAIMVARKHGCKIIGLTAEKGKKLAGLSDACVMISSERTSRIQEAHITIGHIWCEYVDEKLKIL